MITKMSLTLKTNHTKKQIYQNRKKFIKFKIVPYTTMKRKRILEECKEIAEDPIYNKICDYLFVDIEGTIKCKLKNPLKGNLFHNIYTIDGFINGILELVIIENSFMVTIVIHMVEKTSTNSTDKVVYVVS